ncbi:MAG TPA: alanine racemase [Pyrinomonadaceae bacterium]|nr:alanine racemase [Pyrinomonadaceae bacterium]
MNLQTLKTPCLILDIERVRKNAERVSEIALQNNVRLRPHIKTHKCVEVAKIATDGHSGAVTTSTLAEVWAFAKHGFNDFTYAIPIESGKFSEAIEIVKSGVKLKLLTDDLETMKELNEAARKTAVLMDVFVKIDCGYHRVGVEPHTPEAVEIPGFISESSHLKFAGILTHAGHSYHAESVQEIAAIAGQERDIMVAHAEKLRSQGIEVPTVSIGSTPTINHIDHLRGIDEIRPGNYIFFDAFQATLGSCGFEDCALTVLAAVTNRNGETKKIVVDAGAVALSKDRGPVEFDENCGYGRVLDLEGNEFGLRIDSLSQEHGTFFVKDEETFNHLKVGSRVRILANHSCLSAAQHTHFNILEKGEIVDKWEIHRGW